MTALGRRRGATGMLSWSVLPLGFYYYVMEGKKVLADQEISNQMVW